MKNIRNGLLNGQRTHSQLMQLLFDFHAITVNCIDSHLLNKFQSEIKNLMID